MRIKLDENLPESVQAELTELGHNVDTVRSEGIAGHADPEVWAAAQGAVRFFITQDLDFSDSRAFRPGTHHGLLLVRLPAAGRAALTERITEVFRTENVENWQGCFVVLSDHKLRVLKPASA